MSTAAIIPLPLPKIKPDLAKCFRILDEAENDPEKLWATACGAMIAVEFRMNGPPLEQRRRRVNSMTVAFLALAALLGVPREATDGVDDSTPLD